MDKSYIHWNNIIGSYFFCKDCKHKVYLYITRDQLIDIYIKNHNTEEVNRDVIWDDFIRTMNKAMGNDLAQAIKDYRKTFNSQYLNGGKYRYPLYLSFLVLFVLAKAEMQNQNRGGNNVYDIISDYFSQEGLNCNTKQQIQNAVRDSTNTIRNGHDYFDGGCWKELKKWSIGFSRGEFVYTFSQEPANWRYANLIKEQALLTQNDILNLPNFYNAAGINYASDYSILEFRRRILKNKRCFNDRIIDYIEDNNEWQNLVSVIYNHFKNEWDGTYSVVENGRNSTRTKIACYPCVEIRNGKYIINYRLYYDNTDIPYEDNEGRPLEIINKWSESFPVKPQNNRRVDINLEDRDFYILKTSYREVDFLYGTSIDSLAAGENIALLSKKDQPLSGVHLVSTIGDWKIFSYLVPNDFQDNPKLKDYIVSTEDQQLHLFGGAKINNGYLRPLMPYLIDKFNHTFKLLDSNGIEKELRCEERLDGKKWTIPNELEPGQYTIIDEENGNRQVTFNIIGNTVCGINENEHVILNNYGKEVEDLNSPYFKDNALHGYPDLDGLVYPNYDYFQNRDEIYMCQTNNASIHPNDENLNVSFGDMLIDWLYQRGKVSKDEFIETFNGFQELYKKNNQDRPTFDYTDKDTTVKSVIRWLQYQGYVDFDRNKNLIPCSPRFIPLPVSTTSCNVLHLVGCRSIEMISELQSICNKNNAPYSFHYNQVNNDLMRFRLTPTLIYLEVKGNASNNFGLDLVNRNICDILGIKSPDYNLIRKFREFLPSLTDLVEGLNWQNYIQSEYDIYNYRSSYLFRPADYTYDPQELCINDICDMLKVGTHLIKIKKNIYDYSFILVRIENENEVNKITYAELNDQNLGKLYAIYMNSNPNNQGIVTNKCINQKKSFNEREYLAILKKTHMPLMWEKLLNYMSIEIPFLCNTCFYGKTCPFMNEETKRIPIRIVDSTCKHTRKEPCPHRYYLYNDKKSYFNGVQLYAFFKDKLKFEHNENQKFRKNQ